MSTLPASFDTRVADSLLHNCVRGNGDFFALAAQHGLSLDQFIAWFHSDTTQRRIRDLAAIADARTALLARLNRAAAVTRLTQVVTAPNATIHESVRAATAILRTARDFDRREAHKADQQRAERSENLVMAVASPNSDTRTVPRPTAPSATTAIPRLTAASYRAQPYALADSPASNPAVAQSHHDPHLAVHEDEGSPRRAALPPLTGFKPATHAPDFHLGFGFGSETVPRHDFERSTEPAHPARRSSLGPTVKAGV